VKARRRHCRCSCRRCRQHPPTAPLPPWHAGARSYRFLKHIGTPWGWRAAPEGSSSAGFEGRRHSGVHDRVLAPSVLSIGFTHAVPAPATCQHMAA